MLEDDIEEKRERTGLMRIRIHCSGTLLALFAVAVVAAGLFALTGAKPAWAAEPNFAPAQHFPVGSNPTTVTNADFNGDGKMDLAAQNSGSNTVSVLLGKGDGSFDPKQDFTVGTTPTSVISADFNSDGIADLAVANQSSGNVSVLLGQDLNSDGKGDGTFLAKQDFPVGPLPTSVISADFNSDGIADLAAATFATSTESAQGKSDQVSVLLGEDLNGDGKGDVGQDSDGDSTLDGFKTAQRFSISPPCPGTLCPLLTMAAPNQVITADFNGDNKADLATANLGLRDPVFGAINNPGGISVLVGDGDGTFQTPREVMKSTSNSISSITAARLDAGTSVDLVATKYNSNVISVLRGNGDTTFQAAQDLGVGLSPSAVTSVDLDGDAKADDLAVSNDVSDNVSVLFNNDSGGFQAAQHFPAGNGPYFVVGAEFNADSFADLAVANFYSNNVSVLLNKPPDTTPPTPPIITSPANNTIDTDGNLTISGTAEANSTVELFEGSTSLGTTTTNASGNWSKTLPPVGDGTHTYTAKAKDAAGNTSGPSSSLTVEVRIPPVVSSVLPADEAQNVALNASVEATFSEAMDEASVEKTGTFTIKEQGSTTSVAAAVSYNSTTKMATLDPSSNLAPGTTYTATILGGSTGAKDLAGNALAQDYTWTFTTATPPPPPPAPPTVVSYTPTLITGVPRGTEPNATFSTNMDESTLTPTTVKFQVYNKKKKKWIGVAHGVTYDAATRTATVTHETPLAASKKYRVTVTTNVRSSSGLALDQNANTSGNQSKAWTFTTGSS